MIVTQKLSTSLLFFCLLVGSALCYSPKDANQYQPVIGVFTQPSNDLNQDIYPADKYQYISSSYVKWLQTSGARVIPIPYDLSEDESDILLSKINGLLFPGGDASQWVDDNNWTEFSPMTLSAQRWIRKIIALNTNGTHFPVWGTCMGYEMIVLAITNNVTLLDFVNSTNHVLDTHLVDYTQSELYQSLSGSALNAVQFKQALYYNHRHAVTLENFANQPILTDFFDLTSYAIDNNGTAFVATLEGKKVPIYLSQFHPEKNSYEWLEEIHANHSNIAIIAAQEMGNFLVSEARRNKNRFTENEVKLLNIEESEFKVVYDAFVSVYVFKNKNFTETEQVSYENNRVNIEE